MNNSVLCDDITTTQPDTRMDNKTTSLGAKNNSRRKETVCLLILVWVLLILLDGVDVLWINRSILDK